MRSLLRCLVALAASGLFHTSLTPASVALTPESEARIGRPDCIVPLARWAGSEHECPRAYLAPELLALRPCPDCAGLRCPGPPSRAASLRLDSDPCGDGADDHESHGRALRRLPVANVFSAG